MGHVIIIDESGAMHLPERYFCIGGVLTDSHTYARSYQKKVEAAHFRRLGLHPKGAQELKGHRLTKGQRSFFIGEYLKSQRIEMIGIVMDKNHITHRLTENLGFNYYFGLLFRNLIKTKKLHNFSEPIEIYYDERSISLKNRRDFNAQMNNILYEMGVDCECVCVQRKSIQISEIRMADVVSNTLYNYFSKQEVKIRLEADYRFIDRIFINQFPFRLFGK